MCVAVSFQSDVTVNILSEAHNYLESSAEENARDRKQIREKFPGDIGINAPLINTPVNVRSP